MTPINRAITLRMEPEVYAAMEQLRERDGIVPTEQIRRAIVMFLESKGIGVRKGESKRKK
jgi:hypothetical protein